MTFAKIKFSAQIRLETGLHIGSDALRPLVLSIRLLLKIPLTEPYLIIPGSSLKGKMRTLLPRFIMKR